MYALPLISWSRIPRLSISRSTITHTPITLYRTSNSRIVSQKLYRNCYQKWINLNNNLCIEWFDESDRLRFMRTQGKVLLETYEALKPGAFKADLFRLCILYQKGGVYVDAETMPYVSLREMLKGVDLPVENRFISALDAKESGGGIHNGFIISSPRHPFLKAAIDRIISNVRRRSYEDHCLAITGPVCLARAINSYLGRDESTSFSLGMNGNVDHALFLFEFKWGPSQHIYKDKLCILTKKHCLLSYLMSKMNPMTYSRMYRQHKVY